MSIVPLDWNKDSLSTNCVRVISLWTTQNSKPSGTESSILKPRQLIEKKEPHTYCRTYKNVKTQWYSVALAPGERDRRLRSSETSQSSVLSACILRPNRGRGHLHCGERCQTELEHDSPLRLVQYQQRVCPDTFKENCSAGASDSSLHV